MPYVHGAMNVTLPENDEFKGKQVSLPFRKAKDDDLAVEDLAAQVSASIEAHAKLADIDGLSRHLTIYIWPSDWQARFEQNREKEKERKERERAESVTMERMAKSTNERIRQRALQECIDALLPLLRETMLEAPPIDVPTEDLPAHITGRLLMTLAAPTTPCRGCWTPWMPRDKETTI